ncbi:MAG: tRNA pseudouridine(55) synthase TruB [Thermomicrobiales bacterium]
MKEDEALASSLSPSPPEAAQPPPPPAPPERSGTPSLHGYLVIDKPGGLTSFDVVARVRRLLGEKRIGHAGTLDPAATGVLPLAVGLATKTLEYLTDATKTYLADITFGVETDSHDGDGRVTRIADPATVSEARVREALTRFLGAGTQIPPMHAAIKIGGQKLYELARRGEEIERAPRPVTLFRLDLVAWDPPVATVLVDCSKGTYVRSLARDLGAVLGPGAYLSRLVRLRSGPFHLCQAITLGELAESPLPWSWPWLAVHPDAPLLEWPALLLDDAATRLWRQGTPIPDPLPTTGSIRVYDCHGSWLGAGHAAADGAAWQPAKVVPAENVA